MLMHLPPPSPFYQVDLIAEAVVTPDEVEALAKRLSMRLFRTCVSDNLNVTNVFEHLAAHFILTAGGGGGAAQAMPTVGDLGTGSMGGTRSAQNISERNMSTPTTSILSPQSQKHIDDLTLPPGPRTPVGSPPPTPAQERVYDPGAADANEQTADNGMSRTKHSNSSKRIVKGNAANKGVIKLDTNEKAGKREGKCCR